MRWGACKTLGHGPLGELPRLLVQDLLPSYLSYINRCLQLLQSCSGWGSIINTPFWSVFESGHDSGSLEDPVWATLQSLTARWMLTQVVRSISRYYNCSNTNNIALFPESWFQQNIKFCTWNYLTFLVLDKLSLTHEECTGLYLSYPPRNMIISHLKLAASYEWL